MSDGREQIWPHLSALADWQETCETVHLWTQIIGKIRLELSPPVNHSWGTTLYVTPRGLSTSAIPCGGRTFEITLDLWDHILRVDDSSGRRLTLALRPMSVKTFYHEVMSMLGELRIDVAIYPWPVEIPDPILRFDENEQHAAYDAGAIHRFWQALVQVDRVFKVFRAEFIGKASPVHFFWGAFDLAVTRFSGRTAPRHPGGIPNCPDRVMIEAYSHEVSSAGFWPGQGLGEAGFYSYAYPEPDGLATAAVQPAAAHYSEQMSEYILPYRAVQEAPNPDSVLLAFLRTTYDAAADLASWERAQLEREVTTP